MPRPCPSCCGSATPDPPPCCPERETFPSTLYLDYSYSPEAPCGDTSGSGTLSLTYDPAWYFPLADTTAPAWVGCLAIPDRPGYSDCEDTSETECGTVVTWYALSFDPAVVTEGYCAYLEIQQSACGTVLSVDGRFTTCAELPTGTEPPWQQGAALAEEADMTCDTFGVTIFGLTFYEA